MIPNSALTIEAKEYGRRLMSGCDEPMIFHCNYYNYWLQKNLLINAEFGMASAIRDAATVQGYQTAHALVDKAAVTTAEAVMAAAAVVYARQGFGTLNFTNTTAQGGLVTAPSSHYGQCLFSSCKGDFTQAQNLFDRGFAAGVAAAAFDLPAGSFSSELEACHSLGNKEGLFRLKRRPVPQNFFSACGPGLGSAKRKSPPPPWTETNVDEAAIHQALAGLDFSGNEEGLIPRFGVMLTDHFANFYNRISFHFLEVLEDTGLREVAEELLVEAGHRCAFNTFGGIMISPEWQAVVQPMCKTPEDWVHGIVAVINTFGWGTWRVHALTPERLVVHIYDDYESRGYIGMYGTASHPVNFLATGGAAGIMNLIYTGHISQAPVLDNDFYLRIFEAKDGYHATPTQSMAMGAPFTEIVVERQK